MGIKPGNMASGMKTCKILSQLAQKQTARALLLNRGRMFLSTSAVKRYDNDHHGEEFYVDHVGFPFPAIRFKEDTPAILKLKEKEKGDWKKMTIHEKKELYRASYCQTLVETKAPTGEWKAVFGIALVCISLGLWGYVWLATYAYDELPITMTDEEHLKGKIQKMIDLRVGAVDGFASNYDYEKNQWKRMPRTLTP